MRCAWFYPFHIVRIHMGDNFYIVSNTFHQWVDDINELSMYLLNWLNFVYEIGSMFNRVGWISSLRKNFYLSMHEFLVYRNQWCWSLPLNLVPIGPSSGSRMLIDTEFCPDTSTVTALGSSGGRAWSQPRSILRNPFTRRSHKPICLSASVPAQPVTDGPLLPWIKTISSI